MHQQKMNSLSHMQIPVYNFIQTDTMNTQTHTSTHVCMNIYEWIIDHETREETIGLYVGLNSPVGKSKSKAITYGMKAEMWLLQDEREAAE